MAVELTGLAIANVAYLIVGIAAFVAGGWVTIGGGASWRRIGAAYLFGIVVLVIPASYLTLLGVPVGLGALVTGLVVIGLAIRRTGLPRMRPRFPRVTAGRSPEAWIGGAITLVALVLLAYAFRTFLIRPLVENDAWAVWTVRARLIYQDPGAAAGVLRGGQYGPTPYPLALPTLEALGFGAMGRYDGTLIGAQLAALLFGFVGAMWSLFDRRARPVAVGLAIAAVVCAPQLLFRLVTHYVDVPLGLFVGLGLAAAAAWSARPDDGWLLACSVAFFAMAALTKSEGLMFTVAAAVALLLVQAGHGWRTRMRPTLIAVGVLAAIVAPWRIYCAAYGLSIPDYNLANVVNVSYLSGHSNRVRPIVRELWRQLIDSHHWGFLVAAIALGIATGLAGRRWRATAFAAIWLALASVGLVLIYWVSRLPTAHNLNNSSYRTIISLLVGGTSLLPLLIGPHQPRPGTEGTFDGSRVSRREEAAATGGPTRASPP